MSAVAVVSGGGTGIGRAIASGLAQDGFDVVILGRRAEVLAATSAALNAELAAPKVSWRAVDLSQAAQVDRLVTELPTVDVIVNNAGGSSRRVPENLTELGASWSAVFEQNVLSAVLLTYGLVPKLTRPGGRIITIGSMSSRSGGGSAAYVASKAALNGWVVSLSADYAPVGITANVVLPGYVPGTGLGGDEPLPTELHDRLISRIAAGRAGLTTDAAGVVRFLASAQAGFVTGQVIAVDGGSLPPNR